MLTKRPWFKKRRLGWGLSPATWQGWIATAVFLTMIFACAFFLRSQAINQTLGIVISVALFSVFAIATGEWPGRRPR